MTKKLIISLICFCLFSCKERAKTGLTQKVFIKDVLVINLPGSVEFIEGVGIDSYVGYLIDNKKDTLYLEYGEKGVINSLHDISPPVFHISQKDSMIKRLGREPSTDEVLFSEYAEEDGEQKIFDSNYFMYDTINGIVVKIIQPKKRGNGITGLYIPKLKNGKSFSIYGSNLDSTLHQKALMMFKTISYK